MDMRKLLEAMNKFAGEPEQKSGDQVRGTELAKKSKDHPFKGRLVGDSVEPTSSMLGELDQYAKDTVVERSLAERWAQFKEEAFQDTEEKRSARKGSREEKVGRRGHKEQPRYKKLKEIDTEPTNPAADPNAVRKAMAATSQLKSVSGTSAPAPTLAKALDAASSGQPVSSTDAKVIEPMMDIVSKAATDPKLANQFKNLAMQAKNTP